MRLPRPETESLCTYFGDLPHAPARTRLGSTGMPTFGTVHSLFSSFCTPILHTYKVHTQYLDSG